MPHFSGASPDLASDSKSVPAGLRGSGNTLPRLRRAGPTSTVLTLCPPTRLLPALVSLLQLLALPAPLPPPRGSVADTAVSVQAATGSNTMAIYGPGQTKELTELVPGILNQLGPDSLANLRRLAESYQSMTARQAAMAGGAAGAGAGAGADKKEGEVGDDDDEIPDLVENFDEAAAGEGGKKASDLEELE